MFDHISHPKELKRKSTAVVKGAIVRIRLRTLIIGELIPVMCVAILLLFITGFFLYFSGKVYPGVQVHSISLGGKTLPETKTLIQSRFEKALPEQLSLRFNDRQWTINRAAFSASVDAEKTAIAALSYGRRGSILGNIQAVIRAGIEGNTIPLQIRYDPSQFSDIIAAVAADIDIPLEEPSILVEKNPGNQPVIAIKEGRNGRVLDQEMTKKIIVQQLQALSASTIDLPITDLRTQVTPEDLKRAQMRAQAILPKQLTVKADSVTTVLQGDEIVRMLDIVHKYDRDQIASFTALLAGQVNRPPQDATIQFEGQKVVVFKPSLDGLTLNETEAMTVLQKGLDDLESTSSASLMVDIALHATKPKVSTAEANNLGIKELLGEGVSYYTGSSAERIFNITLLTSKLNGVLIPPGQVFSIAQTIGDISSATGYKQAYIIQNGRTVLGDGGGSCQPTTTLFRAAINSGLPIEERHPHAYRVSYYEQGGFQPGFDASIFTPDVDLKFTNDTDHYILIQAKVVPDESKLIFSLYGTKDNREISISKARVWDVSSAPPPQYIDDPTMPKGQLKQIDWAAGGAKAAFDYKITKDGRVIQEKTFFTNYQPWQAKFLRGTKEG